ncbi:GNAT family N-acetyltransferase [Streptomyces sp. LHD-70]|uniref:GNAT family N-acetyltransferase n=1 Tax=Streptomyces sp. LHD-70 TaxID=3072140 RepID=UPI00280DBD0C|nr:GNAT family N-acetyltransferase [Streptomyces sp. LHD-70]MDQ8703937.1 GNAT family N-acetyltransferase [Streptomyces sp. LHD-70]
MRVRLAYEPDLPGLLSLAAQVERWFGPMVDEPGFHRALTEHLRRSTALVADADDGQEIVGGLLFGPDSPTYHVDWLIVSARVRGQGVGSALLADALRRFVREPGTLDVVTFGADHPGAVASGARVFYERLGFVPGEAADPGPEGGSRQVYRRAVTPTPT